ncbi:MAG: family 78 glycoside hydrolase catalytic domain [Planctomycetota bacterium]
MDLRCEYLVNPLGVDAVAPRLSWELASDERGQRQTAFRVLVASDAGELAADRGDLWDTGVVASPESIHVEYRGRPLESGKRCHWKVMVFDAGGRPSAWSGPAWWEMGLVDPDDWDATWIDDGRDNPTEDAGFYRDDPAPLFRKEFTLVAEARKARLYISGLGCHEAHINGARVGDSVLDPAWTEYGKRVYYSTYEVTEMLRRGENCIGVTLGNGWYNPLPLRMWGRVNLREHLTVGRPRFIAQLEIELVDGTTRRIASDRDWRVTDGPISRNSVYLGEAYDARREVEGWDLPGRCDAPWRPAREVAGALGVLQAQPLPPIRITERFGPVALTEPAPGVYVFDMGRNFGGWASLTIDVPRGTRVTMRYGELLHGDGTLNVMTSVCGQIKRRDASRCAPGEPPTAWQSDVYVARGGGPETYTPRFTFHGFRYCEVKGLPERPALESLNGLRLGSDVRPVGEFACSNERLNAIQEMCTRTFLSNLFGVQSDCPHRERFGYGGDMAATAEAFIVNFDMSNFYAKAAADFADAARPDGMLTDTAPFVGIQYCGVAWAMALQYLLDQLCRYYGDRRSMELYYGTVRRWLALVGERYPEGIVTEGLHDHEALTRNDPAVMVTPMYYTILRTTERMARAMNRDADAREYAALAAKVRAAYRTRFVREGVPPLDDATQSSVSFALHAGMLDESEREASLDWLAGDLGEPSGGGLSTGMFGTKFLLDELSRGGRADVAMGAVDRDEFPGWGHMLSRGATTLWEHWESSDDTYSHNHPMFGSVSQWFFHWLGGIRPADDAVGFDRIDIRPQLVPGLTWVRSSCRTVRGVVKSEWRLEGGRLELDVRVPVGAVAEVHVPTTRAGDVTEGGLPVADAPGLEPVGPDRGAAVFRAAPGGYHFVAPLD